MNLDNFSKKKTLQALSNIANGRKADTPLLNTIFSYTKPSDTIAVDLVYDTATGKILPVGDRSDSNKKTAENTQGKKTRHAKTVNSLHIPTFAVITPDEIEGIPELTNEKSLESFNKYMQGEIEGLEESLEATREFHCLGALDGKVVDKDGTVIEDLYALFNLTKKVETVLDTDLDEKNTLHELLHDMKSDIKKKLKGSVIKGFVMFCGAKSYKEFAFAEDTQSDTKNNKLKYVVDGFSDGFNYQSIDFVEYTGGIGDTEFIGENEAKLVPIVKGLCNITPTPGVGTDFVNKKGQKTYITTKVMDHNVGVEIKAQSNYLCYLSVPDAIGHIEITITPEA